MISLKVVSNFGRFKIFTRVTEIGCQKIARNYFDCLDDILRSLRSNFYPCPRCISVDNISEVLLLSTVNLLLAYEICNKMCFTSCYFLTSKVNTEKLQKINFPSEYAKPEKAPSETNFRFQSDLDGI